LKAAPAPAPSPLEALLAGLGALLEAHKASAIDGPARVLWRVLASLHALALPPLAAPSVLPLEALEGEPLAAGMALRERGVPAPSPAPQLSGVHRELIGHAQELLEELDETRWHAQQLASDLEAIAAHGTAFLAGAQETLAALRSALHLAEGSGCALSANLSGEAITAPPGRHLATLARLWAATGPDRAELAVIDARNAAEAFASASP
jgi:hypothetical protein